MKKSSQTLITDCNALRTNLLAWYQKNARDLPWRLDKPDPYKTWLSEIMLQQTTVQAVIAYFLRFCDRWPDFKALAEADDGDVMAAWAGLGYYSRARNLLKCARVVDAQYAGVLPDELETLTTLPGIGEYTASAIRAIAYGKPATVVDGNVERVVTRLFGIETPLPLSKSEIRECAALIMDESVKRPGDLAQAFMDLGAGVCTPKKPKCALCPIKKFCVTRSDVLPIRAPKVKKPVRVGEVFWVVHGNQLLVEQRPESGLLGGMTGLPTSVWKEVVEKPKIKERHIRHVFTHFELYLVIKLRKPTAEEVKLGLWVDLNDVSEIGFPTVFKKVVRLIHE